MKKNRSSIIVAGIAFFVIAMVFVFLFLGQRDIIMFKTEKPYLITINLEKCKYADEFIRDNCYFVLGATYKNLSLCGAIDNTTLRWSCYNGLAMETRNPFICDAITDTDMQQDCKDVWFWTYTRNQSLESFCDTDEEQDRDYCWLELAQCQKIIGQTLRERCYKLWS